VTIRFSTIFLGFGLLMYPFPYDVLPILANYLGYDGFLVGGVLMVMEGPLLLITLLSALGLLVYSLIKRRPWIQFLMESVATACLLLFLPAY